MKECTKCKTTKEPSEFYTQKGNRDGLQGRCKVCCREGARQQMQRILASPEWRERELDRHREKARRYREAGVYPNLEASRKAKRKWEEGNRHKKAASSMVNNAVRDGRLERLPCTVCGRTNSEGHHEDYSKPLDVVWYCPTHHAERHVEIRREARARKNELAAIQ